MQRVLINILLGGLLAVVHSIGLAEEPLEQKSPVAEEKQTSAQQKIVLGCGSVPELRYLRPLDFGDIRIPDRQSGYLTVTPRGAYVNSTNVLVTREPLAGELALCGPAEQPVAITVEQPQVAMGIDGGRPVAREIKEISIEADGMRLQRTEPGRWEGTLGPTGRATVRLGATVYFSAAGKHGTAGAEIDINVVAR